MSLGGLRPNVLALLAGCVCLWLFRCDPPCRFELCAFLMRGDCVVGILFFFFSRVCSCAHLRLGWWRRGVLVGIAFRLGSEMLSSGNILLSRSGNSFSFFFEKKCECFCWLLTVVTDVCSNCDSIYALSILC